jgi:hypothetical protein
MVGFAKGCVLFVGLAAPFLLLQFFLKKVNFKIFLFFIILILH